MGTAGSGVSVRLRGPDGRVAELGPGAILGRSPAVQMPIDDPRVSEAHALVSLRRGQLHLLALRRRFYVGGHPVSEARLRRGLELELAPGLALRVDGISRPKRVAVLEAPELGARVLAGVVTIHAGSPPRIVRRYEHDGDAHLWNMGERWRLRVDGEEPRDLAPGDAFEVGGSELRITAVPVESLGCTTTRGATQAAKSLHLIASYDTVELRQEGRPVAHINGVAGRVLAELVAFGGPVSWSLIAQEVWPGDEPAGPDLRHRWDVTLSRLRKKVRDAGLRRDLVKTDGSGQVWLVMFDGDTAVDRS